MTRSPLRCRLILIITTIFAALVTLIIYKHSDYLQKNNNWTSGHRSVDASNQSLVDQYLQVTNYLSSYGQTCRLYFEFGGKLTRGRPKEVVGIDGQKAVCLDAGVAPSTDANCLVYSFGIADDWSFDESMEAYGCDVMSFDPSINDKDHRHSAHIQFFKMGLGTRNVRFDVSQNGWKMATLDAIRRYLQHQNRAIDYLKIDIEGAEWKVLQHLLDTHQLNDIKQMSIELHLLDPDLFLESQRLIERLESSGFVRFFSRENPWMRSLHRTTLGVVQSAGYELAWYNANFSTSHSSQGNYRPSR